MSKDDKWDDLLDQLLKLEAEFNRSHKCLNKTKLPSENTQAKHLNNLVLQHNTIAATLKTFYPLLTAPHKETIESLFTNLKSKFASLLKKFEISNQVPTDFTSAIDLSFVEEDSDSESKLPDQPSQSIDPLANPPTHPPSVDPLANPPDHPPEPNNPLVKQPDPPQKPIEPLAKPPSSTLPSVDPLAKKPDPPPQPPVTPPNPDKSKVIKMNPVEFLNIATKLLPDFDGKYENLARFLDALNLVNSIKETHEILAVNLIKSKLTGTARNLISTEATISDVKQTLQKKIKGDSTDVLMAKLLNIKQSGKSANVCAKEIEETTKLLQNAYISDGLSPELAEKYSTQTAVKSVIKNAKSEKVKLIMQAGQFTNMNEAIAKFVEVSSDADEHQNVNYIQYKNKKNSNRPFNRGRGNYNRGNYSRGNYSRGNYSRGNNNRNNYNRDNRQNQNSNNYRNNNSNRGQSTNMRFLDAIPENGIAPQSNVLGAQN